MSLAQLLFPVWVDDGLDSHKAFIVHYATRENLDLLYHFDNAEVTRQTVHRREPLLWENEKCNNICLFK